MNQGLEPCSPHAKSHALPTTKNTPAFYKETWGRRSRSIVSCCPDYFPGQLLEDSPTEVGIVVLCYYLMFSGKDNKDEIKKCLYKVVFKGDVKILHIMLQSC